MNDVIVLHKVVKGKNPTTGAPNATLSDTSREVYAAIHSVGYNEFYQATAIGVKLEFVATVYRVDYEGELEVIYDGNEYKVERTYAPEKTPDLIELHCSAIKAVSA